MISTPRELLLRRLGSLERMPSLPIVITQLLAYFQKPPDQQRVGEVVALISQDESLAARCLHLANSPLFGRYQTVDTVHAAVVALGFRRMHEIAASCCLLSMAPESATLDPVVFWEHSMQCALMSRRLAHAVAYPHSEKAYLAGLLHDIGVVAHLSLAPAEFLQAFEMARAQHISLQEAEMAVFGLTHAETGRILAERWRLGPEMLTVIAYHHQVQLAPDNQLLTSVVSIADLLCRMNQMGYGYTEHRQVDLMKEPAFECLMRECAILNTIDWARLTFEMESYLEEVRRLVAALYRPR